MAEPAQRPGPDRTPPPPVVIPMDAPERNKDRRPPHNIDAEQWLLSACMLDADAARIAAELVKPEDFFRDAHAIMFRAILVLLATGSAVDAVTVADELTLEGKFEEFGGDRELGEIANAVPHAANVAYHADIVRQLSVSRQAIILCGETIDRAYSRLYTSSQLLDHLFRGVTHLRSIDAREEEELSVRDQPAPLGEAAYHGPIGAMVKAIEPHTEASPAAILVQSLVAFGNLVGPGPHWRHETTRHGLNLFACIVGNTAKGRKGTSWSYIPEIFNQIDPTWSDCLIRGANSGEVLIDQVSDDDSKRRPSFRSDQDKRLFLLETEFARVLSVFTRQGNSLSTVLRQFWESGDNAALSRNNSVSCRGAHVSLVGHVPPKELNSQVTLAEMAQNGLGNRFLWIWSTQSKSLATADTFRMDMIHASITDLMGAAEHARCVIGVDSVPMGRSASAKELWLEVLPAMREPRPGLLGELLSRGPAQVMRLAAIYALTDRSTWINRDHLAAALEVWDYSVRSVDYIFADKLGDKEAEELLAALRAAGPEGVSQTDVVTKVFKKSKSREKLSALLTRMVQSGLIHKHVDASKGGRPVTMWRRGPEPLPPPPPRKNELTN